MPGGVVNPLPKKTREAIERQLPGLPIGYIASTFVHYQLLRGHKPEPPSEVRTTLDGIAKQAADLYISLGTLSEEARNHLWDALEPVGGVAFFEQANFVSQALMGLAQNAANGVEIGTGRPATWKHGLVRSLANILEGHGRTADSKQTGDLCFLSLEVLTALDEKPGDVRSLVRDALAKSPAE